MNEYMKIAKELADENLETNAGGPFGACIVKNGKIIGKGSNQVIRSNDPTAHAEVVAIKDACNTINSYDLSGCEMYTSCYPCPMCLSAIIWANIKKVYYGNMKEDAENIGFRDKFIYDYVAELNAEIENDSILKLQNIDRDETIKSFREFEDKKNKTVY